jgi:ribonuclease Z
MKTKLFIFVGALTLAILVGLSIFKNQIAMYLFRQNIERQVGWDLRDDLQEGLHVAFCGTGSPLPDPGRGGACTAVIANDRVFLFDAGEGAAESLALMGIAPSNVEAVFLTHFHSDHINGLGALALQHVFQGNVAEPLLIYGGPGVERVVNGFNEAFAQDHGYRVAHHGADVAPAAGFELAAYPVDAPDTGLSSIFVDAGITISAFKVHHESVSPAYGYRISDGKRSVVISGDTAYSANLVEAAMGADLLVHEALAPRLVNELRESALKHKREGLAVVMRDIPSYHASPSDAVRAATESDVPALALTHLIPGLPGSYFDDLFLDGAGYDFAGDLWITNDGDVISILSDDGYAYIQTR